MGGAATNVLCKETQLGSIREDEMFAVTSTWAMDTTTLERQAEMLPVLLAGATQNEGFVRGFLSHDIDDPAVNGHTSCSRVSNKPGPSAKQ